MILETTRTTIRLFQDKDLFDLHEYASFEGLGESAGWEHHKNLTKTKKILNQNINNVDMFAIELKQSKKVIGHIVVNEDYEGDRDYVKELGFVLHQDYHNQGIMSEVIQRILDYLFKENIERVYACAFENNHASIRLIEKCGFTFEKEGTFYFEEIKQTIKTLDYVYTKDMWLKQL